MARGRMSVLAIPWGLPDVQQAMGSVTRLDKLSDEALLAGLGAGDRRTAVAFVHRFERRVYGLALTLVGDRALAEDIAQEALTRAWRHAEAYDPRRGTVATWLLTITRNLAVDTLRLRRPDPRAPLELADLLGAGNGLEPGPADAAIASDEGTAVRAALHALPVEQRRALVLTAFHGHTAREVAELEGIPLGTAKTRIRAGLIRLRLAMSAEVSVA
jgi:RNA polymerase sigma factor (sigma-70 family)